MTDQEERAHCERVVAELDDNRTAQVFDYRHVTNRIQRERKAAADAARAEALATWTRRAESVYTLPERARCAAIARRWNAPLVQRDIEAGTPSTFLTELAEARAEVERMNIELSAAVFCESELRKRVEADKNWTWSFDEMRKEVANAVRAEREQWIAALGLECCEDWTCALDHARKTGSALTEARAEIEVLKQELQRVRG